MVNNNSLWENGVFARYRTDVKTLERVRQIYLWNQNKSTNMASRQLVNRFWDNSTSRWLTGYSWSRLAACVSLLTFSVLGSPLLLPVPAHSVFSRLCPSVIKPQTGGFFNSLSFFNLVRNTAADLWLIQFRDSGAYKIICPLATPSCDCSAANRPRLKSADT